MEKVAIINSKELKELEKIQDYILGIGLNMSDIIYDLEEDELTIEEVICCLKNCKENIDKIDKTFWAILNGQYNDKYKLEEYYFGK